MNAATRAKTIRETCLLTVALAAKAGKEGDLREACDLAETAIADAIAEEREACAVAAEKHKGAAANERHRKGLRFTQMQPEAVAEIEAEERGEDIAAEIIARTIRARTNSDAKP